MERVARSQPRRNRGSLWGVGCFVFPRIYLYFPWNGVEWGDQTREVLT